MKRTFTLIALLSLCACASITADSEQTISVNTTPTGATCQLSNHASTVTIDSTPGSATVARSFSPLLILCEKKGVGTAKTTLEPSTRNRAYGNILLGGYPAFVDASTGAGYEYTPDSVSIHLTQ